MDFYKLIFELFLFFAIGATVGTLLGLVYKYKTWRESKK